MPNENPNAICDLTIIGAGPSGLFGSFYAGLRELCTTIFDVLPEVGGQLAVLYPEKFIYDVPGHPKILAKDLVKLLQEQAMQWKPTLCLGNRVTALRRREDGILELDAGGITHLSKTALITAGVGAFTANKLTLENIGKFENRGVYYFVKDKALFRGKRLLIVGGGDSAVDWALNLKEYAKSITLIHRRDQFRAAPASITELMRSSVNVQTFHEIKRITGENQIERAVIFDNRTKAETTLDVDAVLLNLGFKTDLGPIRTWGLELIGTRYIKVNARMETSVPGVYAAGDIAAQPDVEPVNLIATGFAQATLAVNVAVTHINPQAKVFPGHSSERRL
ncbi:MAG: NAD(P)/FAD-dependent oxidoreductase [Chloroflexota bacterium]